MISWFAFLMLLFGMSWAAVGLFRMYAIDQGMLDEPSARSSHLAPTPRGGGVVFFFGWIALFAVLYWFGIITHTYAALFLPAVAMGLLGFWDDHRSLSASIRLFIQCLAAVVALCLLQEGGDLIQDWLPFFLPLPICFMVLVVGIVWVINLFNFMDGSDGIAATEAIFVFTVGGYLAFQLNAIELGVLAWGLAAILAGFLAWNWPTARIFMGDSGSYFLGTMVTIYALISYKFFAMPLMLWVLLTALFWFDATITLLRRLLAGEEWRKPHRSHAYQRLIQYGWSHQKVLLGTIVVNTILSGLTVMAFFEPRLMPFAFAFAMLLLTCLYILVEVAKPMFKKWHKVKPSQE